jgi:hypothetical protein
MERNDRLYCNRCNLAIDRGKYVAIKIPGTTGNQPNNYEHYHNRTVRDCWAQQVDAEVDASLKVGAA